MREFIQIPLLWRLNQSQPTPAQAIRAWECVGGDGGGKGGAVKDQI